jgi:hypothetical protein
MISRRPVVAVALAAAATLGVLGAADAAPTAVHAAARHGGGTIQPITNGADEGVFANGVATVRKARTRVRVPFTVLRAYANDQSRQAHDILYSVTPTWAVSHPGLNPRFGIFPVTHSAVLGFGAIPITADLHLSQLVRRGRIAPLRAFTKNRTQFPFISYPTHVRGFVELRISNVRVDRVPLNVGPNCRSAVPMKLDLVGKSPAYNLFTGGPLHDTVTIPRFAGCGTGGDDLDPLLTGMISGPGNGLELHQGNLAPWNIHQPNDCGGCQRPKG